MNGAPYLDPGRPDSLTAFWSDVARTAHEYDLYRLLREVDARSGNARLGYASSPSEEPVRLSQEPSLAFAPATLASVRLGMDRPAVSIYSFGLFGPNGPLPLHLTEYVRERVRNRGDTALASFTNLFHHRLILLFYRAWADAQAAASLDRGEWPSFDRYVGSLIHLGSPALQHRDDIADHASYYMSGHLVRQTCNAEGLVQILRHDFGIPVRIIENVVTWLPIPEVDRTVLRARAPTQKLANGALLGHAVRDACAAFRIILGPLLWDRYHDFLPGTAGIRRLTQWVRRYLGVEWAWEVLVVLAGSQVRGCALGGHQRLAYDCWLGPPSGQNDIGELIYTPEKLQDAVLQQEQPR